MVAQKWRIGMKCYHKLTGKDHTYVVCAYKESAFLEECIESLKEQTVKSNIKIATSTPNDYIKGIAKKYGLELFVNTGEKGLSGDWNYAYSVCDTPLVTIAHQDDVYLPLYTERIIEAFNQSKRPLIAFSDYGEYRDSEAVFKNRLLRIKRMLLFPLRFKCLQSSVFVRRRVMSLGSAICCPAVSFYTANLPKKLFTSEFRSNSDWQAWERLSKSKGDFVFVNEPLMLHRIHEESTTSKIIAEDNRGEEDYIMFCKFWPRPIARLISGVYKNGEKSNDL